MVINSSLPPKVFVSHGSEDKKRFVEAFAQDLRANGIDAWYDRWEIGPGDSMVQRIFEEGIGQAQAVIIVVSKTSVNKPWVRAELETSVVQKITKRGLQLIPVVIDQDLEVPIVLAHLRWVSAQDLNVPKATREVVEQIFGVTRKPPIGKPPAYLTTGLNLLENSSDDAVLNVLLDTFSELRPAAIVHGSLIEEKASRFGLAPEAVRDSIDVLHQSGKVMGRSTLEGRWIIKGISSAVWLEYAASLDLDLDFLSTSILAAVVNTGLRKIDPTQYDAPPQIIVALFEQFQTQGLLKFVQSLDGTITITVVTPLAKRALAQKDV